MEFINHRQREKIVSFIAHLFLGTLQQVMENGKKNIEQLSKANDPYKLVALVGYYIISY
jgi:hypothetical protein